MSKSSNPYNFPNKYSNICLLYQKSGAYQAFKLKQNIQSLPQASYSPIFTLSAFILFHHNKKQPPRFQCDQKTNGKIDLEYPNQCLTVNNYQEPWNDYLSNLVVEGKLYQDQENLYFIDFVNQDYASEFQKSQVFQCSQTDQQKIQSLKQSNDFPAIIQQIFSLEKKKIQKTKRMAAVCLSSGALIPDRFLPKIQIPGLFFGIFYRQTDIWKIYRPIKNIFPTQQQLQELDGIILSGSAFSAYQNVPQINKLMKMIEKAYRTNKKLRILGFCFGHQLIAHHFGGRVEKMPQQIVHLQNIILNCKLIKQLELNFFDFQSSFLSGKQNYLVSQYHGDAVTQQPQQFLVIGSSQSCQVEAMISSDKRILSYQFHMQYTPEYAGAYELRLRSYDPNSHYGRIYDGSSKLISCDRNKRSHLQLRAASRKFLESSHQKERDNHLDK